MEAAMPAFYICHHDERRTAVTAQQLSHAQACDYNTLTTPITTDVFQARVRALLSNYLYSDPEKGHAAGPVPTVPSLTKDDTYLAPENITPQLLGVASPWIDLCSPDPAVYDISRQVLKIEVAFAAFCGLSAIVLPALELSYRRKGGLIQYANVIQEILEIGMYVHFSLCLPMMDNGGDERPSEGSIGVLGRQEYFQRSNMTQSVSEGNRSRHEFFGSWDAWNVVRSICKYNSRLLVDLVIPRKLPPSETCYRWMSEPLRILSIDVSTFYPNPSGYPSLTANHRTLIIQYMRLRSSPCILLTGVDALPSESPSSPGGSDQVNTALFPTPSEAQANEARRRSVRAPDRTDPLAHLKYLRWFQGEQPKKTHVEVQGEGYQDYLQAPLQPLTDNLESITYEVFEKDPVKYDLYEQAISQALQDWRSQNKPPYSQGQAVVVAVVGAGRGPLVTRALNASQNSNVPIELWALEKNPNAFVMLQRQNAFFWNNQVRLVSSDMRSWKGPRRSTEEKQSQTSDGSQTEPPPPQHYPIDIIISELLGSFADNELSPECLDGILHLLNPTHGISIPESYSAHLTPIAAPKLHAEISARGITDPSASHIPYVVLLQAFDYLSRQQHLNSKIAETPTSSTADASQPSSPKKSSDFMAQSPSPTISEAWSFSHKPTAALPTVPSNNHNARHTTLSFPLRSRGVCHGLAGYFESVLYPGVELSTNPLNMEQKSPNMMSWFPIFFPLKTPLYAPDDSRLEVTIFRQTDGRRVWYEWMVEVWKQSSDGGEGYRLGVSELMSSKEKACLM